MLRLDWNLVFNMINLLILYYLLIRFLFQRVRVVLKARQTEAEQCFVQAEQREALAKKEQTKYEGLLKGAQQEKEEIVAQARKEAAVEYDRIVEDAKEKAGGIVEDAKEDAKKEKAAILQEADSEIKDLVMGAVAKVVGASASGEQDSRLYDCFLKSQGQNGE